MVFGAMQLAQRNIVEFLKWFLFKTDDKPQDSIEDSDYDP